MDLTSIIETDVARYELRNPVDNTPLGIFFDLAGPEHESRKSMQLHYTRALRRRINRTGKFSLEDPAEDAADELANLATATLGWQNLEVDGKPYPYSAKAAADLYGQSRFAWVRRQIRAALDDAANFIQNSPTV